MQRMILAVAMSLAASGAMAQGTPDGNPENGAKLFAADGCYQCHGYVGQGSIRTGPALAPAVIPLAAFTAQLRKPMDRMPPYTEIVLSSGDIQDIYAYLKSLPRPPNPADIALLQP